MKEVFKLVASKEFDYYDDMYKIVDFLNKNLANTKIVVGLSNQDKKQLITIYEEKVPENE